MAPSTWASAISSTVRGYSPYSANPNSYFIQKQNAGSYFGVTGNGMSVSFLGIRGKQEIADGLYGIFNLQAAFNPASGMGDSGLASITQNNGLGGNLSAQNAFGDSSRNGQMFATAAYFGIDSPTYGAFTMGRQSSLLRDGTINYDPVGGAQAFSLLGTSGTNAGGGSTENAILDNTYKYAVGIGPVRLAAMIGARTAAMVLLPATLISVTSGSTIWASRWTSPAARSSTLSAPSRPR